jgi:hypothetical protein
MEIIVAAPASPERRRPHGGDSGRVGPLTPLAVPLSRKPRVRRVILRQAAKNARTVKPIHSGFAQELQRARAS